MTSLRELAPQRVVPVVVVNSVHHAEALRNALLAGGLSCAEITIRTDAAIDVIRVMAEDPSFTVGAGTILSCAQVDEVIAAGARFVVSPGLSESVVRHCQEREVPVFPGVVTATEIMQAVDLGLTEVKFFPAGLSGGVATIRALAAPFPGVRFLPTGGVSLANMREYLAVNSVIAVGGSWLTPTSLQDSGDFQGITELTAEAVAAAAGSP